LNMGWTIGRIPS